MKMNKIEIKQLLRRTFVYTALTSIIYAFVFIYLDKNNLTESLDLGIATIHSISRWYDLIFWFFAFLYFKYLLIAINHINCDALKFKDLAILPILFAILMGMMYCEIFGFVIGICAIVIILMFEIFVVLAFRLLSKALAKNYFIDLHGRIKKLWDSLKLWWKGY